MSESNRGFSFFLNSSPKEINEKDNPSLEYIVIQNDFLHKKVKELECQIDELVKEKDEFEEDNERSEKRLTALRGITFNECEMSKLLEVTVKGYKQTIKEHQQIEEEYNNATKSEYSIISLFFLINYFLGFIGVFIPLIMFYLMGIVVIANSTTMCKNISEKAKRIKLDSIYQNKEKEYADLRKNQDYISTMIENM